MEYNITTEPAASSSSPSSHQWEYDVFLSFRGADTLFSVVDPLYSSLLNRGIATLWADDQLKKGGDIPREIFEAIEKSRISVVIFSENYASSTWCLDELAKIIECKNSLQQIVLLIFNDVDPSDVIDQTGTFGEAFVEHEDRFKDDLEKVSRWRAALTEATKSFIDEIEDFPLFPMDFLNMGAAGLSGMVVHKDPCDASKFINAIIGKISRQLNHTNFQLAYETDYLVGIDSRLRGLNDHLDVGVDDVRMVGILRNDGMGKTTIAKAVYNSVAHKFKASCFLGDVRENSKAPGGLVPLQKSLLYAILGLKIPRVTNVDSGVNIIKSVLRNKKILLIIDDVDQLDQLKYLAGSSDWFGAGSRIIITTKHRDLLADKVALIYEVKQLERDEALKLFSYNAFPRSKLPDDYKELALSLVEYAKGNPLILNKFGSFLYGKSIETWRSELERVKNHQVLGFQKIILTLQSKGFFDWMFLIISLILEIISAICDQFSSSEKPKFAVIGVVLAILALVICVSELIYKGKGFEFGRCRMCLWWFFCPKTDRLFGTLPDLFGLICGISQCASSIVQCVCVLRRKDNTFKVNLLPIIFLICVGGSKLFEDCKRRTGSRRKIREESPDSELVEDGTVTLLPSHLIRRRV